MKDANSLVFYFSNRAEILYKNSEIVGCLKLDVGSFSQTVLLASRFRPPA